MSRDRKSSNTSDEERSSCSFSAISENSDDDFVLVKSSQKNSQEDKMTDVSKIEELCPDESDKDELVDEKSEIDELVDEKSEIEYPFSENMLKYIQQRCHDCKSENRSKIIEKCSDLTNELKKFAKLSYEIKKKLSYINKNKTNCSSSFTEIIGDTFLCDECLALGIDCHIFYSWLNRERSTRLSSFLDYDQFDHLQDFHYKSGSQYRSRNISLSSIFKNSNQNCEQSNIDDERRKEFEHSLKKFTYETKFVLSNLCDSYDSSNDFESTISRAVDKMEYFSSMIEDVHRSLSDAENLSDASSSIYTEEIPTEKDENHTEIPTKKDENKTGRLKKIKDYLYSFFTSGSDNSKIRRFPKQKRNVHEEEKLTNRMICLGIIFIICTTVFLNYSQLSELEKENAHKVNINKFINNVFDSEDIKANKDFQYYFNLVLSSQWIINREKANLIGYKGMVNNFIALHEKLSLELKSANIELDSTINQLKSIPSEPIPVSGKGAGVVRTMREQISAAIQQFDVMQKLYSELMFDWLNYNPAYKNLKGELKQFRELSYQRLRHKHLQSSDIDSLRISISDIQNEIYELQNAINVLEKTKDLWKVNKGEESTEEKFESSSSTIYEYKRFIDYFSESLQNIELPKWLDREVSDFINEIFDKMETRSSENSPKSTKKKNNGISENEKQISTKNQDEIEGNIASSKKNIPAKELDRNTTIPKNISTNDKSIEKDKKTEKEKLISVSSHKTANNTHIVQPMDKRQEGRKAEMKQNVAANSNNNKINITKEKKYVDVKLMKNISERAENWANDKNDNVSKSGKSIENNNRNVTPHKNNNNEEKIIETNSKNNERSRKPYIEQKHKNVSEESQKINNTKRNYKEKHSQRIKNYNTFDKKNNREKLSQSLPQDSLKINGKVDSEKYNVGNTYHKATEKSSQNRDYDNNSEVDPSRKPYLKWEAKRKDNKFRKFKNTKYENTRKSKLFDSTKKYAKIKKDPPYLKGQYNKARSKKENYKDDEDDDDDEEEEDDDHSEDGSEFSESDDDTFNENSRRKNWYLKRGEKRNEKRRGLNKHWDRREQYRPHDKFIHKSENHFIPRRDNHIEFDYPQIFLRCFEEQDLETCIEIIRQMQLVQKDMQMI